MDALLPSELARLVYGYLLKKGCSSAAQTFLETCPLLAECLEAKQKGRSITCKIGGLTLDDILEDHRATCAEILNSQENFPVNTQQRIGSALLLTEKLKLVVNEISKAKDTTETVIASKHALSVISSTLPEHETVRPDSCLPRSPEGTSAEDDTLSEPLSPSLFLPSIFENTELHEVIAQNMNRVMSGLPLAPDNVNSSLEFDTAIHSVVEQTEADPVFQRLIDGVLKNNEVLSEEEWTSDKEQISLMKDCELASSTAQRLDSSQLDCYGFQGQDELCPLEGNPAGASVHHSAACQREGMQANLQSTQQGLKVDAKGDKEHVSPSSRPSPAGTAVDQATSSPHKPESSNRVEESKESPSIQPAVKLSGGHLKQMTPRTSRFGRTRLRRQIDFSVPDRRISQRPPETKAGGGFSCASFMNVVQSGQKQIGFITAQKMQLHPDHPSELDNTYNTGRVLNITIPSTSTSIPIIVQQLPPLDCCPPVTAEEKKTVSRKRARALEHKLSHPKTQKIASKKPVSTRKSREKPATKKHPRSQLSDTEVPATPNPIDSRKEWDADLRVLASSDLKLQTSQWERKYKKNRTSTLEKLHTKSSLATKKPILTNAVSTNVQLKDNTLKKIHEQKYKKNTNDRTVDPQNSKISEKRKSAKGKKKKVKRAKHSKVAACNTNCDLSAKKISKNSKMKIKESVKETEITSINLNSQTETLVPRTNQQEDINTGVSCIDVAKIAEKLCHLFESDHSVSDDSLLSLQINTSASSLSPSLNVLHQLELCPVNSASGKEQRQSVLSSRQLNSPEHSAVSVRVNESNPPLSKQITSEKVIANVGSNNVEIESNPSYEIPATTSTIPRTSKHNRKNKPKKRQSNPMHDLCNFVNRRNVDSDMEVIQQSKGCNSLLTTSPTAIFSSNEESRKSSSIRKGQRSKKTYPLKLPATQITTETTNAETSKQNIQHKKINKKNDTPKKGGCIVKKALPSTDVLCSGNAMHSNHPYFTNKPANQLPFTQTCQDPDKGTDSNAELGGQATSDLPATIVVQTTYIINSLPLKKRKSSPRLEKY